MNASTPKVASPQPFPRFGVILGGCVLLLAGLAAYHDSFSGSFVYDDVPAIPDNPSIRHLWPLASVLEPSVRITSGGRPLLNLTLALNYAVGGTRVWGYHALNLAIHLLGALALFGIVRRTLLRCKDGGLRTAALPLAFCCALLWTVHPLQTEAVTYVVQRAESLMGLCYLLTLYAFIRAADADGLRGPGPWLAASVLACLAGMAAKEVMVSAPVMVLLYDRTFVSGSFREAWLRRRGYYLGLACTWLLLGALVRSEGGNRGGSAGFDVGVSPWAYWLTQPGAIMHYLRLSVWPHPLVFEYGPVWVKRAGEALPSGAVVAALALLTVTGVWRGTGLGFLGAWFFSILAPTSVVPGTTQMIVEHRMYLALAPVVVALVLGLHRLVGRRSTATLAIVAAVAAAGGWMTEQRNRDYRDERTIWADTAAKRPDNPTAHNNLGMAWMNTAGHLPDAIAEFREALRIDPDDLDAHLNLGTAYARLPGHLPDAIYEFKAALRIDPDYAEAHNNLGTALEKMPGRLAQAGTEFEAALRIDPDFVMAHNNLGLVLLDTPGRLPDAIAEFRAALRIKPDDADAHDNLGAALARIPGRLPDAVAEYRTALRLNPNHTEAYNNLGSALLSLPGHLPEAISDFEAALRIDPESVDAQYNLGVALSNLPDRLPDAIAAYQAALRLKPDHARAHYNLGVALASLPGRQTEAIAEFREAIRCQPDYAEAYNNLGNALSKIPGRLPDAVAAYEAALRIDSDDVAAHFNLGVALARFSGRQGEAIAQFEAALRLRPSLDSARTMVRRLEAAKTSPNDSAR